MHMRRRQIRAAIVAALLALSVLSGGAAFAQGKAMTTVCENPAGNEPKGQCRGEALEQTTVNPAGHAPPGQQR
jgi:hypothetical protein